MAAHLAAAVAAKVDAGEPAFVYGHPERRLGRYPEVLAAVTAAAAGVPLLWRVTLTEFARWWRWRAARRWSVVPQGRGAVRGPVRRMGRPGTRWRWKSSAAGTSRRCRVTGPRTHSEARTTWPTSAAEPRADLPSPRPDDRRAGLKAAIRSALDWETVTPVEELRAFDLASRLKKGLRVWQHARQARASARTHFRAAGRREGAGR